MLHIFLVKNHIVNNVTNWIFNINNIHVKSEKRERETERGGKIDEWKERDGRKIGIDAL